jgi:hypothetical protein
MKKLLVVFAALLLTSAAVSAKGGFGVTAGFNTNAAKLQDVSLDSRYGWNAGLTYLANLPLGFSVQPSLLYTQKRAAVALTGIGVLDQLTSGNVYQSVGSVTIPVSVQWGPDLIVARPFLDVTPYVGYALTNKLKAVAADQEGVTKGEKGLDYGIGLGAGINVWKLQAVVRYNWNFGTMGNLENFVGMETPENAVYGGISVNVAYFF